MAMLIRNVRIVNAKASVQGDILIDGGKFVMVGGHIPPQEGWQIVDGTGRYALPGLVDIHVHLRDPGQTHKEDIATGCDAAKAGGVTSLFCMPNTVPTADSPDVITYIREKAAATGVKVYPVAAITHGIAGDGCCDYATLQKAGAAALSDDGRPVEHDEMLLTALREGSRLGLPVTCHCEDLTQAAGGKVHESVAQSLGVKGISSASEYDDVARTIRLAEQAEAPVHICHVSTKESIDLIRRAKARGVRVTCETAPHYCVYTCEKVLSRDADYRMNPPLREEADRLAVMEGLLDGTIDAIATDHAPHTPAEKVDFAGAPNGVIGMETSLAAVFTFLSGTLSPEAIVALTSTNPARIMHIEGGEIKEGAAADLVLFDPAEAWIVDPERLHGKSRNAVFKGETLVGKVKATYCNGQLVFADEDEEKK
ncbi:MAG: dihydroorotase [Clostridia bacterium]|nr:dihydroorotase [Clostridia bacterium]